MSKEVSFEVQGDISKEVDEILDFVPRRDAVVVDDAFAEKAQTEGSGKYPVLVDCDGFTQGMRQCCLDPFLEDAAMLTQKIRNLDAKCAQYRDGLNSYDASKRELLKAERERDETEATIEEKYKSSEEYSTVVRERKESNEIYEDFYLRHGRIKAVAMHPAVNASILVAIGITEFFINYESILSAYGMPALSLGVATIIAAVMAFVSHVHGTHLRQHFYRYGEHVPSHEKRSNAAILGFATTLLSVLLAYVGFTRYQHLNDLVQTFNVNAAGQWDIGAAVTIDVGSKVSMLTASNVLVWALGIMVVYYTHDKDPEYMKAARRLRKAEKEYLKWREEIDQKIYTVRAQFQKKVDDSRRKAESLAHKFKQLSEQLDQVATKIDGINETYRELVASAVGAYYSIFSRVAGAQKNLAILQGGKSIDSESYVPPAPEALTLCSDLGIVGRARNTQDA